MNLLVENEAGPPTIRRNGVPLVRFMERVYLHRQPFELVDDETRELANIRLETKDSLLDRYLNADVNRLLIRKASKGRLKGKILDFGSGDGSWPFDRGGPLDGELSFHCVDISSESIAAGKDRRRSHERITWDVIKPTDSLPADDETFDGAFAQYVMQFNISDFQLSEIYRCLKWNRKFVFNYHWINDDDDHFDGLILSLRRIGFRVEETEKVFPRRNHKVSRQKIVVCKKPRKIEMTGVLFFFMPDRRLIL